VEQAVVCRNCHGGLVSAKGNLDACYTPGEVLRCKMGDEHSYTLPWR
jgi:hypothetical protein